MKNKELRQLAGIIAKEIDAPKAIATGRVTMVVNDVASVLNKHFSGTITLEQRLDLKAQVLDRLE